METQGQTFGLGGSSGAVIGDPGIVRLSWVVWELLYEWVVRDFSRLEFMERIDVKYLLSPVFLPKKKKKKKKKKTKTKELENWKKREKTHLRITLLKIL